MTMLLARIARSPTMTVSLAVNRAVPRSHSTLFFLNRDAMPPVRVRIASRRCPCMPSRSSDTSPTLTPNRASEPDRASW